MIFGEKAFNRLVEFNRGYEIPRESDQWNDDHPDHVAVAKHDARKPVNHERQQPYNNKRFLR